MIAASSSEPALSLQDLCALARRDFGVFVELTFPVLHPVARLEPADYLDLLFEVLTAVREDAYRRVVINLPPGFMKSMLVSIMFVAWRLGIDPSWKVVCISYGDDLAHKHSAATRLLMQSPMYQAIFPETVLQKKAEDHLTTTKGGYRYATAVGSDITGFRPHTIIIDDPMEPEAAVSELAKERLRAWVLSSVLTRFEDPSRGALLLVMHRLAPDDLSATIGGWDAALVIALPLVAEQEETFYDRNDAILMRRTPGDSLNPQRWTAAAIARLKSEIPPHVFASQYQQRPTSGGSGLLSPERLRRYTKAPKFDLQIHSWDVGATVGGNPSVCTKWGIARDADGHDVAYLTDVIKLRIDIPDLRAAIKTQDGADKPDLIIIDHRGVGLPLFQDLQRDGYCHVVRCSERGAMDGKLQYFALASLAFYDGAIAFPTNARWIEEVIYALASFPDLKEFDLVDSITQLASTLPRALMYARRRLRPAHL